MLPHFRKQAYVLHPFRIHSMIVPIAWVYFHQINTRCKRNTQVNTPQNVDSVRYVANQTGYVSPFNCSCLYFAFSETLICIFCPRPLNRLRYFGHSSIQDLLTEYRIKAWRFSLKLRWHLLANRLRKCKHRGKDIKSCCLPVNSKSNANNGRFSKEICFRNRKQVCRPSLSGGLQLPGTYTYCTHNGTSWVLF